MDFLTAAFSLFQTPKKHQGGGMLGSLCQPDTKGAGHPQGGGLLGNPQSRMTTDAASPQRHRQVGDTPLLSGEPVDTYQVGGTTLRSDGSASFRVGQQTIHSDGVVSSHGAGTTINSDGTTSYSLGGTSIHSDGTVSFKMPGSNMIVNSDGHINFVY